MLIDYFNSQFLNDLGTIERVAPNKTILANLKSFYLFNSDEFFGGQKWKYFDRDIEEIKSEHKEDFLLTLLVLSSTNYFLRKNIQQILLIKNKNNYFCVPVFGHCGLSPHFEHPNRILIQSHIHNILNRQILENRSREILDMFNLSLQQNNLEYRTVKMWIINNEANSNFEIDFRILDTDINDLWNIFIGILIEF